MSTCRCRVKWFPVVVCVVLLAALAGPAFAVGSIALEKRRVADVWLHLITADLNDPRIRIDIGLPAKGLYHSESFSKMIKRSDPVAAVTGTYFDTRSLLPVGTIVVGGKVICTNQIGTTVTFTGATRVSFVGTAKGESCELSDVDCSLRTGPRLLAGGAYVLNPAREGFRHPGLFGRHRRVAMGVTEHNKLLLVVTSTPITFARTATVMKRLGATDAVCLDGGTSSAMYYRGKLVCKPGRSLTNIVEVHWSPAYADRVKPKTFQTVAALPASTALIQPAEPAAAMHVIASAEPFDLPSVLQAAPEEVAAIPELSHTQLLRIWRVTIPANLAKSACIAGSVVPHSRLHSWPSARALGPISS